MAVTDLPAASTASEPKKKPRMNPARRRAARAKSEVEPLPSLADSSTPKRPQLRRVFTIESIQDAASVARSSSKVSPTVTRPSQVPRQKTEPIRALTRKSEAATNTRSPQLSRTVTAPPTTDTLGVLSLRGPALVTGGLLGCAAGAAVLLGVQLWYDFAGAESAILAAKSARLSVDNLTDELITSLKGGTYSADEALDMLRRTTLAYASTIPGETLFVERIFREIQMVRRQRGREVDQVVAETYAKLSTAGAQGATSAEMRDVVIKQLMKLSTFASNATQDVVARNPRLKPFREEAAKAVKAPIATGTPTLRMNMAVRQKQSDKW